MPAFTQSVIIVNRAVTVVDPSLADLAIVGATHTPEVVHVNELFSYDVVIQNNGTGTAIDMELTGTFTTTGVVPILVTTPGTFTGDNCNGKGETFRCSLTEPITATGTITKTIAFTAPAQPGNIDATFEVSMDVPEANLANNTENYLTSVGMWGVYLPKINKSE
jgi:hypothetical protein